MVSIRELNARIQREAGFVQDVFNETGKVIVGQEQLIQRLLIALLCNSHVLIEGVPGLAKTLAVRTLSATIDAQFQRIQFTPDLLPADLIGTQIYNPGTGEFTPRPGPVFANIILADEINRAPAKVQSALLEAMEERQVTLGDQTHPLYDPFLVLATQNPIEQEGTYPLPEAQIDRFMLKIKVDYPTTEEEKEIMDRVHRGVVEEVRGVVEVSRLNSARETMKSIHMEEKIVDYIVRLTGATREPEKYGLDIGPMINYGASPRASIWLGEASRAHAFLSGRGYVTPQDVKSLAPDVFRHRLLLSYEAEAEGKRTDDLIHIILERIEVP
jgi:MoxR-like ATPase